MDSVQELDDVHVNVSDQDDTVQRRQISTFFFFFFLEVLKIIFQAIKVLLSPTPWYKNKKIFIIYKYINI